MLAPQCMHLTMLHDSACRYSTFIFTDEISRIINNYQTGDAPMFLCLLHACIQSKYYLTVASRPSLPGRTALCS